MNKEIILGLENTGERGIAVSSGNVYSFHTHSHMYYEMLLYEPFDGQIIINGNPFCIDKMSAVLISPYDFHSIHVNDCADKKFIKAAFTEQSLSKQLRKASDSPVFAYDISPDSFLAQLFYKINLNCTDYEYTSAAVPLIIAELTQAGTKIVANEFRKSNSLIFKAVQIISEHFTDDLTLCSLAAQLNVSPQYLCSIFSKTMGISFSNYLCDLRLRYAARLLCEGRLNITEICYECGYRNLSHFLRSFKKKFGTTPKKYVGQ